MRQVKSISTGLKQVRFLLINKIINRYIHENIILFTFMSKVAILFVKCLAK